jgi:hypothetical protein
VIISGAGVTVAFAAVRKASASSCTFLLLMLGIVGMFAVEIGVGDEEGVIKVVGMLILIGEELGDEAVRGEFLIDVANMDVVDIDRRNMLRKRMFILSLFGDLKDI